MKSCPASALVSPQTHSIPNHSARKRTQKFRPGARPCITVYRRVFCLRVNVYHRVSPFAAVGKTTQKFLSGNQTAYHRVSVFFAYPRGRIPCTTISACIRPLWEAGYGASQCVYVYLTSPEKPNTAYPRVFGHSKRPNTVYPRVFDLSDTPITMHHRVSPLLYQSCVVSLPRVICKKKSYVF